MKKTILILLLLPTLVLAQSLNLNYPPIRGVHPSGGFAEFIIWLYYIIIVISSAAAFGAIVWGGIEYLTSAGNPSRIQSGLSKIKDALIGLLLVLISYLVLQAINPKLTEIKDLTPPSINLIINQKA